MSQIAPRAFVVGWPIQHSRSPLIHNYWLKRYGLAGSYERLEVSRADFPGFLKGMKEQGFAGGNVTLPHKETAFQLVEKQTETARRLKAVNTLWIEEGVLWGDNTDLAGFLHGLDAEIPGWDKSVQKAIVLGSGGAARAVVYGLVLRNIPDILVINRTLPNAAALALEFGEKVRAGGLDQLPGELQGTGLLINATSLGMVEQPPLNIDLADLPPQAIVYDIVYAPLETALLSQARARGLRCVGGLSMLLHQAVPGFERWFGIRPEVTPELWSLIEVDVLRSEVIVLGLTGSIGMGKSTTAGFFTKAGIPVFDADAAVHELYEGEATPLIEQAFPGTSANGKVDRKALSKVVLKDDAAMQQLEKIVHPLVRAQRDRFLCDAAKSHEPLVVLDVPLLLETQDAKVDYVVLATAPEPVQKARLMARPGMTDNRLAAILARQMPDAEKRKRADFIIDTSLGLAAAEAEVNAILSKLLPASAK